MIPFHSLFPELAQREVRCIHAFHPSGTPAGKPPRDEYLYVEYYCDELDCDCRRVFLQVISKNQPGKVFASIGYGWENERFYRRKMPWDPDEAMGTVRGELDPFNEQSEFAEEFLHLFKTMVLDEPYRLRLRRHYHLFRAEVARRAAEQAKNPAQEQ